MNPQATQTKVMTRLGTLEAKVQNMERGIKPWVDTQLDNQDRWVQLWLYAFEIRITQQLGSDQTSKIDVKAEVVETRSMVDDLYARSIISEPEVTTFMPDIHILNIWVVLGLEEESR